MFSSIVFGLLEILITWSEVCISRCISCIYMSMSLYVSHIVTINLHCSWQRCGIVDPYQVRTWPWAAVYRSFAPQENDLASSPPWDAEVYLFGILLHTSCLISEFLCLTSLHVCNKDAISYINKKLSLSLKHHCRPVNIKGKQFTYKIVDSP